MSIGGHATTTNRDERASSVGIRMQENFTQAVNESIPTYGSTNIEYPNYAAVHY